MTKDDSMFLRYITQDTRYNDMSLYELLKIREAIYKNPNSTKYERALIQYHIMKQDGRM